MSGGQHISDNQPVQLDWLNQTVEKLSEGFPDALVLLDCETTGLKPTVHRMIEVALLVIEQGEITRRWQTLINPERHVPVEIRHLTGITPDQLRQAPVFADIAGELLSHLQDRILVAHNARFDYSFLKNEFSRAGINYTTKPLCSVKLSRKLFPQYKRHGLSEIIRRYDFQTENRHRALDDALVIWKLFLHVSQQFNAETVNTTCDHLLQRPALPMHLDAAEIEKLPNTPGVYYFYDANDQLLYIGKSVTLRNRVLSHFTQDHRNASDLAMSALIAHIDFETTPSDFGAQLRESQQIKALNPYYNRRLRKVRKLYQYQLQADAAGYLQLEICPLEQTSGSNCETDEQFGLFRSRRQAENRLGKLVEHFFLCQKLCGLQGNRYAKHESCFGYQLKRCLGACCGEENPEDYNQRVQIALQNYRQQAWPWPDAILVEERGRETEKTTCPDDPHTRNCWHLLHEWRYLAQIHSPEELGDYGHWLVTDETSPNTPAEQSVEATSEITGEENLDFDLDIYRILVRFLLDPDIRKRHGIRILPLQSLATSLSL